MRVLRGVFIEQSAKNLPNVILKNEFLLIDAFQ